MDYPSEIKDIDDTWISSIYFRDTHYSSMNLRQSNVVCMLYPQRRFPRLQPHFGLEPVGSLEDPVCLVLAGRECQHTDHGE